MFALGLLLPIIYIPTLTGGAMATQWALISLVVPVMLWRLGPQAFTTIHWLGLTFLAYAFLSIAWSPQPLDAIYGAWVAVLWCLCFQLGFTTYDPRPLYLGITWGLYINIAIACIQWLGYHPVPTFLDHNIAGLLYNQTVLSAACALCALALIQHRLYLYTPPLFLGLALSGSRSGILALAFALIAKWDRLAAITVLVLAAAVAITLDLPSDHERLAAWTAVLHHLRPLGYGPWATTNFVMLFPDHATYINSVHNDYLQFVFEFGPAALAPIAILAYTLYARPTLPILGFACLACFWFPTYNPTTAFIALFALGHSYHGLSRFRNLFHHRRSSLYPSLPNQIPIPLQSRGRHLPLFPRT